MKAIKLIGLSLLAVFALTAFAATIASAEAGFLPRQALATILGGKSTFEKSGGGLFQCKSLDETHIEFENDKHAKATLHWLECVVEIFALTSLGAKTGELLLPVLLLVCLDPKSSGGSLLAEFGIAAEITGTAHLEQPALGILQELKGILLGTITTTGKAKLWTIAFSGTKGQQSVAKCLEGASEKVNNLLFASNHGTFESISVTMSGGLLQFPETTELMDS